MFGWAEERKDFLVRLLYLVSDVDAILPEDF